jgi:hypothetical protein
MDALQIRSLEIAVTTTCISKCYRSLVGVIHDVSMIHEISDQSTVGTPAEKSTHGTTICQRIMACNQADQVYMTSVYEASCCTATFLDSAEMMPIFVIRLPRPSIRTLHRPGHATSLNGQPYYSTLLDKHERRS